jgi:hypothetical protein
MIPYLKAVAVAETCRAAIPGMTWLNNKCTCVADQSATATTVPPPSQPETAPICRNAVVKSADARGTGWHLVQNKLHSSCFGKSLQLYMPQAWCAVHTPSTHTCIEPTPNMIQGNRRLRAPSTED